MLAVFANDNISPNWSFKSQCQCASFHDLFSFHVCDVQSADFEDPVT